MKKLEFILKVFKYLITAILSYIAGSENIINF